ncbi:hypothetical protein [Nocardioides mesophilus]|uniref:Uncharacterized protein n=1 Tax=Nocardioides mesophilus TaxID=433659 RepID=A0A7G9R7F9_9ACTN|nr:hypothetical protein [Nocardioides mesophilus]QNN51534.1 hypothetical protein H9L09_13195 [Nocardioides mesophilus]
MGAGIALVVLGAILTFAVRGEAPGIDIQTVGVILIVAGAAVIAYARRDRVHEEEVVRVEEQTDPATSTHTVRETTTERDAF